MIPNSIMLDANEQQDDDHSSAIDFQNIEVLNYRQEFSYDEVDDVAAHSTGSCYSAESNCPVQNLETNGQHFSNKEYHCFEKMTNEEASSYKILSLLDAAGAPRICYDRLVALLKKLSKSGFDVRKAINRETLMKRLSKYKAQPRIQMHVINNQEVFRFMFQDMLQDLLHSCSKHLHIISSVPEQCNHIEKGTEHELWNTQWMKNRGYESKTCPIDVID